MRYVFYYLAIMNAIEIKIFIHTKSDAFVQDMDGELERVLNQAVDKFTKGFDDIKLLDTNWNGIGRMTVNREPKIKRA